LLESSFLATKPLEQSRLAMQVEKWRKRLCVETKRTQGER
jgi:hypothetical protein